MYVVSAPSSPRPSSCLTIPHLPASLPIAMCMVIGMPRSRAIPHSSRTTSSWQNPGPRVASPRVRRPSSDEKYVSLIRVTSSRGMAIELLNQ